MTFSTDFVESLWSTEMFKEVDLDLYISTAAFVDLARCQVVFCIPNDSFYSMLCLIGRTEANCPDGEAQGDESALDEHCTTLFSKHGMTPRPLISTSLS